MSLQGLIEHQYQTLLAQAQHARAILLHPNSRYRSALIARMVNANQEGRMDVFYYALGPDDISVPSLIAGITHDLANQHPTFGRYTNMLRPGVLENFQHHFDEVLDAFARDLAEISDQDCLFILDEYDRSDIADDVQRFVEKLVSHLPENCRLILNSRTLPRLPWVSMIAKREALILEDDRLIVKDFYAIESGGKDILEVNALGPGYVLLNDQPIDSWEGHLPRLLFFFALDRPVITRSEICQAFWPELDMDQAVNVFHVTKRRLHKALEMDVLVHENGYYQVNPQLTVYYDVMDFVTTLMEARDNNNPNPVETWQRAIDLYRGPFLQGHTDPWISERREDFRVGYMEALMHTARYYIDRERYDYALNLYHRAVTEDIHREDVHRELLLLYNNLGRRSEAAAHYRKFVEELKQLGEEPAPETQQVYAEIMA